MVQTQITMSDGYYHNEHGPCLRPHHVLFSLTAEEQEALDRLSLAGPQ